jgi:hypothetical protein
MQIMAMLLRTSAYVEGSGTAPDAPLNVTSSTTKSPPARNPFVYAIVKALPEKFAGMLQTPEKPTGMTTEPPKFDPIGTVRGVIDDEHAVQRKHAHAGQRELIGV